MAIPVNTNMASLIGQRNLMQSSDRLNMSLERLSTGLKINKARDDASGLVTSELQRAQINGLTQGIENVDRAQAMVQTAESDLSQINGLLLQARQLVVDSANSGTLDSNAIAANQAELDNIIDTIDNIASRSKFGTINLLDGSSGIEGSVSSGASFSFVQATDGTTSLGTSTISGVVSTASQQGERAVVVAGTSSSATTGQVATAAAGGTTQTGNLAQDETLTINSVSVSLSAGLSQAAVVDRINEFSSETGVTAEVIGTATVLYSNEFGSDASIEVTSNVSASATSSGFGTSTLTDVGVDVSGSIAGSTATGDGQELSANGATVRVAAADTSSTGNLVTVTNAAELGTLTLTNNSPVFQIGAFSDEIARVAINSAMTDDLGRNAVAAGSSTTNPHSSLRDLKGDGLSNDNNTQNALEVVDQAITDISNTRGRLGAFQNQTLNATQNVLRTELERLTEAESITRDTDFATEISKFTNEQIRSQAATSMLGLANQQSQSILSLLQG